MRLSVRRILNSDLTRTQGEDVVKTDGLLRIYNIWLSGRFPGHESQSATSGCVVDEVEGDRIYRCNDIRQDAAFDKLVLRLRIQPRAGSLGLDTDP